MAKRHYARLSRKLDKQSATNLIHRRKSQTVSGQSRKVLFVASPVLRKVQTASAQFNATKLRSLEQKATKITKGWVEPGLSFVCYLLFRTSSVPSVLVVPAIRGIRAIRGFPDLTLQRGEANFPRNLGSDFGQYLCEGHTN